MRYSSTLAVLAFAAAGLVKAQDVEADDVPSQCQSVCSSLVSSTANCDAGNSDADQLNCVCSADGASSSVPLCAACISTYGDADNDAVDLVSKCSFLSTTYAATPMASTSAAAAVTTTTPMYTDKTIGANYTSPMTSGYSNGTGVMPTGGSGSSGMPAGSGTTAGLTSATGAAAATALPMFGAGAGAALVALALL